MNQRRSKHCPLSSWCKQQIRHSQRTNQPCKHGSLMPTTIQSGPALCPWRKPCTQLIQPSRRNDLHCKSGSQTVRKTLCLTELTLYRTACMQQTMHPPPCTCQLRMPPHQSRYQCIRHQPDSHFRHWSVPRCESEQGTSCRSCRRPRSQHCSHSCETLALRGHSWRGQSNHPR